MMFKNFERKYESLHIKPWRPDKPVSKGATAFHEAVFNSTWIKDIMHNLAEMVRPNINDGDIVVDFGAGTGTSAILLLESFGQKINLWLVDNSQSWLGKAFELLHDHANVEFFVLEKKDDTYATLAETVGNGTVHHVLSANTVHLIPEIMEAFAGISLAMKKGGTFTFQTGNFIRKDRPEGALMIDDTVKIVHDIAIEAVKTQAKYSAYRKCIDGEKDAEKSQRKLVFPDPRPIEIYLNALEKSGFDFQEPVYVPVKVRYGDWLNFLMVKRLQAGILPEIGGRDPSPKEEQDRDELITYGALQLFSDLKRDNPLADDEAFIIDIAYITSIKK